MMYETMKATFYRFLWSW